MSQNLSPQSSMPPLSVGNVVTAALRLYRSHIKLYLGIALRATLWILLSCVPLIPIPLIFISRPPNYGLLGLIIPIWLIFYIYCFAKYLANSATISRLAFVELIDRPESLQSAHSYTIPRMWTFFRAGFLAGLIVFLVNIGISIATNLILVLPAAILTGTSRGNSAGTGILALLQITKFIVDLFVQLWIQARYFILELPVAVEDNVDASQALGRSWDLTKGLVIRIQSILLVAGLMTIPLIVVGLIPIPVVILPLMFSSRSPESMATVILLTLLFVGILIGLASTVTLPFWQAIKAVIYYDLRTRREGLGLQLREPPKDRLR